MQEIRKLKEKAEQINLLLLQPNVDLWKLRDLALSEGGLVNGKPQSKSQSHSWTGFGSSKRYLLANCFVLFCFELFCSYVYSLSLSLQDTLRKRAWPKLVGLHKYYSIASSPKRKKRGTATTITNKRTTPPPSPSSRSHSYEQPDSTPTMEIDVSLVTKNDAYRNREEYVRCPILYV